MNIIAQTELYGGDESTKPHRIIIWQREGSQPFVCHMQVFNTDGTDGGLHHGNYCDTLRDALSNFANRAMRAGMGGLAVEALAYNPFSVLDPPDVL